MKITDQGFEQMLSLGLLSESTSDGVYLLYVWDDVKYFCGPNGAFESSDLEGVYIELSAKQLQFLPKKAPLDDSGDSNPILKVLEFFETAVVFKVSDDKKLFKAVQVMGNHVTLEHLNMNTNENSPLRILKESKKPFHGVYAPMEPFKSKLTSLGVNTHNLWITAVPIIKDNVFEGVLMGLSQDVDYGLDIIDFFYDCANEVKLVA